MPSIRSLLRGKICRTFSVGFCVGVALTASSKVLFAQSKSSNISIEINSTPTEVSPPPLLKEGAVLVPLRGVLEKLGANVVYDQEKHQIVVAQGGRKFTLAVDHPTAEINQIEIPLSAPPQMDGGSTYVPLRSLAELFGYQVQWLGEEQTVRINSVAPINHMYALDKMGQFGVTINALDLIDEADESSDETENTDEKKGLTRDQEKRIKLLLDAAHSARAAFIKIRFDWSMLEPNQGDEFQWDIFDNVVRGAKDRGIRVVGILGGSTKWASIYPNTADADQWRSAPPQEKYFPDWDNYVRRVVGRYKESVDAWQIWEYPASHNFRSGAKDYRIVVRRAAVLSNLVDSNAVTFASEPGGVDLRFLQTLEANGMNSVVNGIMLKPESQWQPGVSASPSDILLPISTLRKKNSPLYWAGDISQPVLSESKDDAKIFYTEDEELLNHLKSTFTPQAQADYWVKTSALALAAGVPKVSWGALQDKDSYTKVDPVDPDTNNGLLTVDGQQRPAFQAFANMSNLLHGADYIGAVSKGPQSVVLLFADGEQYTAVAWALDDSKPTLKLQEKDESSEDNLQLQTTEESTVLDVTGEEIAGKKTIQLGTSPVWITHINPEFAQQIKSDPVNYLSELDTEEKADFSDGIEAIFSEKNPVENGLFWRKYTHFRGEAQPYSNGGFDGLLTTVSRDVYNPADGNPLIYLDVDDKYLFNEDGTPVTIEVTLYRPRFTGTDPFRPKGGFNIRYDSPEGSVTTPWQDVEQGEGLITYTFDLPRVAFANRGGRDIEINTWGSKQDMVFHSVKLKKIETSPKESDEAKSEENDSESDTTEAKDPVQAKENTDTDAAEETGDEQETNDAD